MVKCPASSPLGVQCRLPGDHVGLHEAKHVRWWRGGLVFPDKEPGWCKRHGFLPCPSACDDRRAG